MQYDEDVSPARKFFHSKYTRAVLIMDVIVILIVVGVVIFNSTKTATIDILTVPSIAKVKIDNGEYSSGTYRIHPGNHTAEISADGFQTKNIPITTESGAISKIYVYLVPEDDNLNYYATHYNDWQNMNLINDEEAHRVYNLLGIQQELPIELIEQNDSEDGGLNISKYIIVKEYNQECKDYYCIKVATIYDKNTETVKRMLAEKSYYLDDYEVEWKVYDGSNALMDMQNEVTDE